MNAILLAERALLRRDFREAHHLSREAIDTMTLRYDPLSSKTACATGATVAAVVATVTPFSLRMDRGGDDNGACRLISVFLQASAELFQAGCNTDGSFVAKHKTSVPASEHSVGLTPPSLLTPTSSSSRSSRSTSALDSARALLEVFRHTSTSDVSIPYPASLVWLTYLTTIGQHEIAKATILNFLRSYEGRLYLQGHWRAIALGCHEDPNDPATARRAQSRFEHLIETLVLDVLVPLNENKLALDFLSQKTDGLSDTCRESLRYMIDLDIYPRELCANSDGDKSDSVGRNHCRRVDKDSYGDSAATDQVVSSTVTRSYTNTRLQPGRDHQKGNMLTSATSQRRNHGRDTGMNEGLSREDIEILSLSAAGLITAAVGVYIMWRKRGSIISRLKSIGLMLR